MLNCDIFGRRVPYPSHGSVKLYYTALDSGCSVPHAVPVAAVVECRDAAVHDGGRADCRMWLERLAKAC